MLKFAEKLESECISASQAQDSVGILLERKAHGVTPYNL